MFFIATGCSSKVLNKEALQNTKKVGILSVTIDRIGENTPQNIEVMSDVVNYAKSVYEKKLKTLPSLELVPESQYINDVEYTNLCNLSKSNLFKKYIKIKATQTAEKKNLIYNSQPAFMRKLASKFMGDGKTTPESMEKKLKKDIQLAMDEFNKTLLSAGNMPVMPFTAVDSSKPPQQEDPQDQSSAHPTNRDSEEDSLKVMFRKTIGDLCKKNNLDGMYVIVLSANAQLQRKNEIVVVSGKRALGSIRLSSSILLITKDGELAVDFGKPGGESFNFKTLMPTMTFTKVGKHTTNFKINLKDKKGKVLKGYK